MNEHQARVVLLVKALESSPQRASWVSTTQQRAASEAALAHAPRPASDARSREWAEQFVSHRAQWLLAQITQQHPGVHWLQVSASTSDWLARGWPLLALLVGWLGENLFSPGHIHLLSPALVAVLAWNWGLLLWLVLSQAMRLRHVFGHRPAAMAPPPNTTRRWWPHLHWPGTGGKGLWNVTQTLHRDWLRVAGPCLRARWLGRLHGGSAWLALGLIASLAWKGLYSQYRVGWESAWVGPQLMHQITSALSTWVGSTPFSLETIQSLQGWATASPPEVGTAWFWLVFKLVVLTVVVPRGLLAWVAAWRAKRLSQHMRLDLTEPYYVALLASHGGPRTPVQVWPYSYTLGETQRTALHTTAVALHGGAPALTLAHNTPYGQLPEAAANAAPGPNANPTQTVALFSMAATPEAEAHGQFVRHLQQHATGVLVIWVDRSSLTQKWGIDGAATARLAEREALWRAFAATHHANMQTIDLGQ